MYQDYFDKLKTIMAEVEATQGEAIEASAAAICDTIKRGGLLHVFGCGHSQMYAMEVFYRAGGLVPVNAILTPALALTPCAPLSTFGERQDGLATAVLKNEGLKRGDTLIIASTSGRNAVPVEMAIEAKKRGIKVIGLHSSAFSDSVSSRHSSNKKLCEVADIVLDNCGESGDAVMSVPSMTAKFGPTSSVIGFAILQAVIVETVNKLVAQGIQPPIWVSSNLDQGDVINQEYINQFKSKVTCL